MPTDGERGAATAGEPTRGSAGDLDGTVHHRDDQERRRDHLAGERDDAAAERDAAADERDQVGDQRDEDAAGRDRAAGQRDADADARDEAAGVRDHAAARRDLFADGRDLEAELRDRDAERRDDADADAQAERTRGTDASNRRRADSLRARVAAADDRRNASADRGHGAAQRRQAERDRVGALADRVVGANQRDEAEHDRAGADVDRGAAATDRVDASVDALTGAHVRGIGLVELQREVDRSRRGAEPLAVAFVDVDDLKAVNDSRGHAIGDQVLREVVDTLKAVLRSYDLVIRVGGDEFVCVLPGLDATQASRRMAEVGVALASAGRGASVTAGLAELEPDDTVESLLARADQDLYRQRGERRRGVT